MANGIKTDAKAIEVAERDANAVKLRLAGATYQQIADQLGYSTRANAYKGVTNSLKRAAREAGEELLELELTRLDQLQQRHWLNAMNGNLKATEVCLRIIDRRCKLLGLDAAIKIDANLNVFDTREELLRQAQEILDRRAAIETTTVDEPAE